MALAQLAPGPLAAQLAIYLGWSKGGLAGATGAAAAFILPSYFMVLGLSALYVRFGGLDWMQSAFYGIGAAVIAIVARSALKLVKMTLGKDRLLWALFAASALATAWTESEIIWLFLGSGVVALVVRSRRLPRIPMAALLPPGMLGALGLATTASAVVPGRCSPGSASTSPRRARSCSAAASPSSPFSTAASSTSTTG